MHLIGISYQDEVEEAETDTAPHLAVTTADPRCQPQCLPGQVRLTTADRSGHNTYLPTTPAVSPASVAHSWLPQADGLARWEGLVKNPPEWLSSPWLTKLPHLTSKATPDH